MSAVEDRLAIDDLITDYVVAVDTLDWDLLASVCTPGTLIDYTAASGPRGTLGEVLPWLKAALGTVAMTQHMVVNRRVSLDGDTANARSYIYNPTATDDGNGGLNVFFLGGYYNDRFVRTPAGWRFAERALEIAWTEGRFPEGLIKRTPR